MKHIITLLLLLSLAGAYSAFAQVKFDGDEKSVNKQINNHSGALLAGDEKLWAGDFGQSFAKDDTAFNAGSKIDTILISKQQVVNLTVLGQLWGFLKYHHPEVTKGKYNWDFELFRILPQVLKATNDSQLSAVLEKWVDALGAPKVCSDCNVKETGEVKLKPDYGSLFTNKILSASLTKKLSYILNNRSTGAGYYIKMAAVGNPAFLHEVSYSKFTYPDAGYRLLCLYRYWNMINYFYPYKYLAGEDWNNVLADCIPKFALAANAKDYALNALALIARIHDTHANIYGGNKAINAFRGKYAAPIQAKFIEDKLVVTGYYDTSAYIKQLVKPGDIIERINGQAIADIVKKLLPYSPASNYATQLRDLPWLNLLKGSDTSFMLDILHDGKHREAKITGVVATKLTYSIDHDPDPKSPGFYLIDKNIGYLFPGKYHDKDLKAIKSLFKDTKGIIIDMRCYPSEFMPYSFGPYIKINKAPFVKFSKASLEQPGLFTITEPLVINPDNEYKGKVVVIVNAQSQSQAEYTTMAFQTSPNVTVIGSQTAGADGDISPIILPGGIYSYISGLGVYYPDGTETQRKGVKIDLKIEPTIAGIKAGKDELLDKAKAIIMGE